MHWADLGVTARLILALSLCGGLIFAVVFSVNDRFTSRLVEEQVMAHSRDVVAAAVYSIDDQLRAVARDQATLATALESAPRLTTADLRRILRYHVATNEEVFGAAIAFAPGFSPNGRERSAPYCFKRLNGELAIIDLASPSYNYPQQPWYRLPAERKAPVWSEPYFDEGGGNVVMTTYSVPFYRMQGGVRRFAGIATSDVSVDWLGRQIASLKLNRNGYAALFSRNGVYLAHPDRSLVMRETLAGVAEKKNNPVLREIGRAITRGESGFVTGSNVFDRESWIYYAPVPATGWSLAVVFPAEEMRSEVTRIGRMIALLCIAGIVVLVLAIVLVARSVSRPLAEISLAVQRIAGGDLDGDLPPIRVGGEVRHLADSFGRMQRDLKEHIRQLTETTAVKERMAGELSVAHDLQMAILPHELPELPGLEIAGCCVPAREVGGDFYDARLLADGRLFFVIGDVSGKGVPAALYMAMAVTLARAGAGDDCDPAELLGRINRELCRGNDSCMFATILCGIIDPNSGMVRLANAGHTPPAIRRADGTCVFQRLSPGLVAGYLEDFTYVEEQVTLIAGDTLILYTDGVTEAMSGAGELFGEARLLAALSGGTGGAGELLRKVEEAVAAFADAASQSDDLTMLALFRRDGTGKSGGACTSF
ncbi:SpoIIE family protein phosphatase [Trichlorobacter ammonificans]|uniref:HAMP domain-containing protein n=1 Tax=Trichlorobacter ammonificans TaxID=2916410 RepID=A0ABN8HIB9_9BACT|nr:SpoIIE family protein phosphatase [Trichlorobacter ammonificans]CAH2030941.1 HAMP domain-containing protein [Trichlorobacter ammonificans]